MSDDKDNKAVVPYREPTSKGEVSAFIPADFASTFRFAELLAASGDLVPKHFVNSPERISTAIFFGAEIGLLPLQSLQSIAVINGRPSIWGDAALALARASGLLEDFEEFYEGGDFWITPPETDPLGKVTKPGIPNLEYKAVCKVTRKGAKRPTISEFSIGDAQMANLWNKEGPWRQYTKRMLKMRARAFAMRDEFTDILRGIGIREELEDIDPIDITPKGDAKAQNTPPSPDEDGDAPRRRGRPAKNKNAYQEAAGGAAAVTIDGEVVDTVEVAAGQGKEAAQERVDATTGEVTTQTEKAATEPPKPAPEQTKATEVAKPAAETSKQTSETTKSAATSKASTKDAPKPAAEKPATEQLSPGKMISKLIPNLADFDDKFRDTLKDMQDAFSKVSDLETLRDKWRQKYNGWSPSFDPDIKAAQFKAMEIVRDFHKERVTKAAEAAANPPAPPADEPPAPPKDEPVVQFDYDGFKEALYKELEGCSTPDEVNSKFSAITEIPVREGLISAESMENDLQPMLVEHIQRVDRF